MAAARDIAILVLVVQGAILMLAVLVAGVIGSVAIIELTVHVRRGLRKLAKTVDGVNERVESIAAEKVIPPVVRVRKANAAATAFIDRLRAGDTPSPPSDIRG